MSITATTDEKGLVGNDIEHPGVQLAQIRQQRGYSVEYVAGKLHLRVHIVELIERGDFHLLPQPVFIKGYLRAYSKLLGVSPDPFLGIYTKHFDTSRKSEKITLWQTKKESHRAEYLIRMLTLLFALGVLVAIGVWWQKNQDNHQVGPMSEASIEPIEDQNTITSEIKLTDLSKMHSLLHPKANSEVEMTPMESEGG